MYFILHNIYISWAVELCLHTHFPSRRERLYLFPYMWYDFLFTRETSHNIVEVSPCYDSRKWT